MEKNKNTVYARVSFSELGGLQGRLLTYVEATFTDQEQRQAHKNLVKQITREWLLGVYEDDGYDEYGTLTNATVNTTK